MSEKPFHERPALVSRCALAGFTAAFGDRADIKAWEKQTESLRQNFRIQAKAILRAAWEETHPPAETQE